MVKNFGIFITSHGNLAKASVEVVEMIAGKSENARSLSLEVDKDIKIYQEEFINIYNELNSKYEYIIVLCDIYGGTPFNTVSKTLAEGEDFIAYCGYSLPILLELITTDRLSRDEAVKLIEETHQFALTRLDTLDIPDTDIYEELDL